MYLSSIIRKIKLKGLLSYRHSTVPCYVLLVFICIYILLSENIYKYIYLYFSTDNIDFVNL